VHCRIFFLSDPRNRGRQDLGCPFGCRSAHRRKRSTERSTAYNRSPAGKLKRKLRQEKRSGRSPPSPGDGGQPEEAPLEGLELQAGVVEYVRVVTSLVEGRGVSLEEVLEMLRRSVRQRSLARERRIDYALRTLKEKPP